MLKKFSYSIISLSIFATSLNFIDTQAQASSSSISEKGTMGYGYQQYLKDHPKKQPHKTQNRSTFSAESNMTETNNGERVLDISEWQGLLTNEQIKQLKKNYDFIILRAQYGSEYVDKTFEKNAALLEQNKMKYGVYSYSMYESPKDARYEANTLSQRAPKAAFYINDYEEQTVKSGDDETATQAWANEMRKLAGNKKILFYSYENFMLNHASNAVSSYDGYWLAAYQAKEPNREKVLWQYTDSYYSPELNQNVDANYIDENVNSSWFTS